MRCGKVKWGTLDRLNFACWDIEFIRWSEIVSIEIENHVSSNAVEVAIKVIIVVVCLVDNCLLICSCLPNHIESIIRLESVCSGCLYSARETIFSIRCGNGELEDRIANLLCLIDLVHPACSTTAVKTIHLIILLQLIFLSIKRELTSCDTVSIATYRRAIITWRIESISILCDIVETEYNISWFAIFIRYHKRNYASTIVCDADFHAVGIGEGIESHLLTTNHSVESSGIKSRLCQCRFAFRWRASREHCHGNACREK